MENTKRKIIRRKTPALCQAISAKCNYVDPDLIADVYRGLIKVIMDDIRAQDASYLPDWGLFRLVETKPHRIIPIIRPEAQTGDKVILPATKKIKFQPCEQLKYYVKNKL